MSLKPSVKRELLTIERIHRIEQLGYCSCWCHAVKWLTLT